MTRDEIMNLSDEELRRRIARLQGYEVREEDTNPCLYALFRYGRRVNFWLSMTEDGAWENAPDYPQEIADAWTLLDELQPPNNDVQIILVRYGDKYGYLEVYVALRKHPVCVEFGPSEFPRAISRAYLIAKEASE